MTSEVLRFDVFGRIIEVVREEGRWTAHRVGTDGKRRESRGTTIPPWVKPDEVGRFLADLYHESATPDRPDVIRLD